MQQPLTEHPPGELPPGAMPPAAGPATVAAAARVGQVITFALAQGVVLIAAVMIYLSLGGGGEGGPQDRDLQPQAAESGAMLSTDLLLPLLGFTVAAVACVAAVLIPGFIRQQAINKFQASGHALPVSLQSDTPLSPPARELVQGKLTATLVSQAVLEGAAMLNAIFLLLSPQLLFLVPVAVAVFGIVVQVPTASKLIEWLDAVRRS